MRRLLADGMGHGLYLPPPSKLLGVSFTDYSEVVNTVNGCRLWLPTDFCREFMEARAAERRRQSFLEMLFDTLSSSDEDCPVHGSHETPDGESKGADDPSGNKDRAGLYL